ncbi:DUF3014 domain-containing protein [Alteromonas sp. ASW11-36]|uniref:DUF3014 domain-containing protein n=1 Tax=Alteromonas arenosi TaxID=3055817 RepID=A0ABT7T0N5_9ALTE|nr:DUF3014 domain-containing protein [Alteromonas sp. ASW11-36]MDM7861997.1 DUF3014 domain-containing protein [Alteromonas sp. ASW11-36]
MSSEEATAKNLKPHIILAVIFIIIIAVVLLWPSSEPEPPKPQPVTLPEVEMVAPVTTEPEIEEPEPQAFTPPPEIQEVVIDPVEEPEPQVVSPVEPEVMVDTSDAAITSALLEIAKTPVVGRLLVNDSLLQRFVVTVSNLADEDIAPNHQLVNPPSQSFKVYRQADREWIDAASYKRYTTYVDALETMSNDDLLELYQLYEDEIDATFAEIALPGQSFDRALIDAIDVLLNTPEVPTPVEVYRDSVMYKYSDERLEALSLPQKQMLRLGPDNMRRVKAKLRALRDSLANGSE